MKQLTFAEKLALATESAKREDAADAEWLKKAAEIRAESDARIAAKKKAAAADAPKA